jgi:uncharacterized membrane protein
MVKTGNQKDRTPPVAKGSRVGVVSGAGAGMVFGAAFGNPGIGLVIGAGAGLVIGAVLDRARKPSMKEQ